MRRARLRGRLLLLVALAVLPAFAVIAFTALEQRRTARAAAQAEALALATRVADHHRASLAASRQLLTALARLPVVRARDAGACSLTFADIREDFPRYTGLFALTPAGDVFCGSPAPPRPMSFAGHETLERAKATNTFAAAVPRAGGVTGQAAIVLILPMLDERGAIVGYIGAGLDPGWLTAVIAHHRVPGDAEVLVVDEQATIVARWPERAGVLGASAEELAHVRRALGAPHGVAHTRDPWGVRRLAGFTTVEDAGARLVVIAALPEDRVLAPAYAALRRNALVLGAVAVCAFAIAWFGAELLLRPLRELVAITRRLAAGELGARATPSSIEELGGLARAFNEMGATLEATQAALDARLRESAALLTVARVVGETPDLNEALRQISRELARLTGADTVAALLVGHDRTVLQPMAGYHLPKHAAEEVAASPLALGDVRFPDELFEGGRVVWTADVAGDPRFESVVFQRFPHRSAAIVPLRLQGETWGVFYLMWWTTERRLADEEVRLLQGISDEVGVLIRTVRLYQEAEARRRIAEAAKERYRLLFERNLAGVFRSSRDGRMLECNDAFARMHGLTRDEALARPAREYYADAADRDALLARLDEDRRVQNHELRVRRANGETFWVLLNITKVNDGTGEYLEGVVIDINDRKQAEAGEREVATLRSVAALANAAAHEINNPLAAMVGHLDLETFRTEDPATRERLEKARHAATRIREIVARMHHVTRLEIAPDPPGLPDRLDLKRSGELDG
ncbi:MAG: PAS domain S-box protein [Candidatus Rokubacteria bacterium]|nr:PAS domain S-box protein [Candidatus Rokubacteria bacterium]